MTEQPRQPDVREEPDRLPLFRILLVGFAALAISAALVIASWMLLDESRRRLRPSGRFPERRVSFSPELPVERRELFDGLGPGMRLHAEKRAELSSYAWVDRRRGLVSIPIEEAMRLVIEEQGR